MAEILKPSALTGEYWLYIGVGLVMLYLESKGISVEQLQQRGKDIIDQAGGVKHLEFVLLAAIYALKRSVLKWREMHYKATIELEKIRQRGTA